MTVASGHNRESKAGAHLEVRLYDKEAVSLKGVDAFLNTWYRLPLGQEKQQKEKRWLPVWVGIGLAVTGLLLGVFIGLNIPVALPQAYAKYMSVAALAALDSVFGGVRAAMEDHYDNKIFITGFFSNALLAAGLAYIGERLGIDLYLAAVVAFGVRLFQNLAIIRRHLLKK